MAFRFRRSVRILPGVKLNLSGSGASFTFGPRGLHYTVGAKGKRLTAGIPGTGLSWSQYTPHTNQNPTPSHRTLPAYPVHSTFSPEPSSGLRAIKSASAEHITSLSTSELAPILNAASERLSIAPVTLIISVALFVFTLLQSNSTLTSFSALSAATCFSVVYFLDRYRSSVRVTFAPEGISARITEALHEAFTELTHAAMAWAVTAQGSTSDWKRNAGATRLNDRKRTYFGFGTPRCLRSEVAFASFKSGTEELYLLPDATLLITNGKVASVSYRDLHFEHNTVRFIEEDSTPSDTAIVDYTWRIVNKKGGPDRRFRFNSQLPVCLYGELSLQSDSGLNCKFQISKSSAADTLAKMLSALKTTATELPKPVTYIRQPKRWPTFAFLSLFMLLCAVQIIWLQESDFRQGSNSATASKPQQSAQALAKQPGVDTFYKKSEVVPGALTRAPIPLRTTPIPSTPTTTLPVEDVRSDSLETAYLNSPENFRRLQARLQEFGYLQGRTNGWDSASRIALREFKTVNGLGGDEFLDERTQKLLMFGNAPRKQQTYIGAWSENTCEPNAQSDIIISSRRAVSSAGGACDFSNIKASGLNWSMITTCTNSGEKWTAAIRLAVFDGKLIWTGRDGSKTSYVRCQ